MLFGRNGWGLAKLEKLRRPQNGAGNFCSGPLRLWKIRLV